MIIWIKCSSYFCLEDFWHFKNIIVLTRKKLTRFFLWLAFWSLFSVVLLMLHVLVICIIEMNVLLTLRVEPYIIPWTIFTRDCESYSSSISLFSLIFDLTFGSERDFLLLVFNSFIPCLSKTLVIWYIVISDYGSSSAEDEFWLVIQTETLIWSSFLQIFIIDIPWFSVWLSPRGSALVSNWSSEI